MDELEEQTIQEWTSECSVAQWNLSEPGFERFYLYSIYRE